jgi:hypothetical protein
MSQDHRDYPTPFKLKLHEDRPATMQERCELLDEIVALKAERDGMYIEGLVLIDRNSQLRKSLEKREAQVERLRAVLEEIANAPYWAERPEMIKMARRALEPR